VTVEAAALTKEQRAIVELDVAARTIVVAGPGAGKTHTLIHRAAALATGDVAASEVLVLSFTNAVVGELRRRFTHVADGDAAYVRPTTIDSLAGRIVVRDGEDPLELGFDTTVLHATAAIKTDPDRARVAHYRHIIVDEAQDLVGVRLAFIEALLAASTAGFTVLGDPAQGIYGFSERSGSVRSTGIDVLFDAFPEAQRACLTEDHRSLRGDASPGHKLRPLVLKGTDPDAAYHAVLSRLRDSDRLTVSQLAAVLKRSDEMTGVLCRNNGEVLYLSGLLADAGVGHKVRRAAVDRPAPSWVARLLGDVDSSELSRKLFDRLASDASEEWRGTSWKALRRLGGSGSGGVDMQRLRENLDRLSPEEAPDAADNVPVLSTVHRSKGLEYDTTIILEPQRLESDQVTDEEIRVLYVAMTRARLRTLRLERPDMPGRLTVRAGRWLMVPWRGRGTSRVELRIGDTESALGDLDPELVKTTQDYLGGEVAPGEPVALRLIEDTTVYAIEHGQTRIGVTGPVFRAFPSNSPRAITGLRIDCVRSAAGDPGRTRNLGIGSGGLWLVPEIVGLGRLQWKESPDERHG
jgi:AAA domain/UvrD-like helicase C-terminal domain